MQRLEEINEVETARGQIDNVQVGGLVAYRRRQRHFFRDSPRAIDRPTADVDAGEGSEREAVTLEDLVQVAGAAPERKRISGVAPRKVALAQPVDPIGLAASRDQVVVIQMHLRNARPRNPFEVVHKRFSREP